jgi:hypothetical protein
MTGKDHPDISKLVREEIELHDKYFKFAQTQIEKDRSYFKYLYTLAVGFIGIMTLVAIWMTYGSMQDVRKEVLARIDIEFRSDHIKGLISNAVQDRTNNELTGIIRSEVALQVTKGIKEQGPSIQQTVEDQTKEAVKALEPTIKSSVDSATREQVTIAMRTVNEAVNMGNQALLARAGDRHAFEYLVEVTGGSKPESANPELFKLAESTALAIIAEKEGGILRMTRSFKQPQSPDSLKHFMESSLFLERQAAVDNYPKGDNSVLPALVQMIKHDPSIDVVVSATARFNEITKQSFEFWKTDDIINWWENNKASFQ